VRRIPFTLLLALTIFITTTVTGTLLRAISAAELVTWGFGAADLAHGRWFHLFLATFQILDPYFALSMLATVLALVGACEYRLGTVRTVIVYALAQCVGFIAIVAVAKLFASLGSRWGTMLVSEHNVGASAGAVGAMGAWVMAFPRPLRTWGVALAAAFLLAAFGGDVHPWDVAHVASFLLGLGMGAWFERGHRPARAPQAWSASPGTRTDRLAALAWADAIVGFFCVLAPFALVDGMPTAEIVVRATPRGFELMRWVMFATGTAMLTLAPLVRSGNARAARIALVAGVGTCVILWQPGAPGVEHVLSILLVSGLVVWRHDFDAPSAPSRPGTRAGLILLACALAFGLFGFVALREHFVPPLGFPGSLHVALLRLRMLPAPLPNWHSPGAMWFLQVFPFVIYGSALASIPMFIRSGNSGKPGRRASSPG
jgi:hypothetical protein